MEYPERQIKEQLWILFSFIVPFLLLAFGLINIISYTRWLGYTELIFGAVVILNFFAYKKHKNFSLAVFVFLLTLFALFVLLIISGGIFNTGIFWCLSFPFITFFISRDSTAIMWNVALATFVLVLGILQLQGKITTPYPTKTILWFTVIYAVFVIPAFVSSLLTKELFNEIYLGTIKDHLTRVYNRSFAFAYMDKEAEKVKRKEIKNFCIVYIDLDNFKQINDKHGHFIGDEVLREVAMILHESFRRTDVVARMGDDEFLLIASNCNRQNLERRLNEVKEHIEKRFSVHNLSISYGIAIYPEDAQTVDGLVSVADRRMCEQKRKKVSAT